MLKRQIGESIARLEEAMAARTVGWEWSPLLGLYRRWAPRQRFYSGFFLGLGWSEQSQARVLLPPNEFADSPATWFGLVPSLQSLNEALQRWDEFNPAEFVSPAVVSQVQSKHAQKPRARVSGLVYAGKWDSPEARNLEIGAWLKERGYSSSDEKTKLKQLAASYFATNVRYVEAAAKAAGLVKRRLTRG